MGCYSDVKIMCEENAFDVLKDIFMNENNCITPDYVKRVTNFTEKKVYLIEWFYTKWYEFFEGVSNIMDALEEFENMSIDQSQPGYGFCYARIGEDAGDVERRENSIDFCLDFVQKIEIDSTYRTKDIPLKELKKGPSESLATEKIHRIVNDSEELKVQFWETDNSFVVEDEDGFKYSVTVNKQKDL